MATVTESHSVSARLIIGKSGQTHIAPRVTAVTTYRLSKITVAGAYQHLKATIGKTQDRGLNTVYRLNILRILCAGCKFRSYRTHIFPFSGFKIKYFKMQLPTTLFSA